LLLHGAIHDDNLTNNDEAFIIYLVAEIVNFDGPKILRYNSLEDQINIKGISWEDS